MKTIHGLNAATGRARRHVDQLRQDLEQLDKDSARAARIHARVCPVCYYLVHRMSGQGFTEWFCKSCGVQNLHHTTAVPMYCIPCSKRFGVCVRCGSDLELRNRRKLERK